MDPRLDQNQAELAVAVLAEPVEVLAHRDGLLDQVVKILRDLRGEARSLEDAEHLGVGDCADLGDAMLVPERDADLGGGVALLGELADLVGGLSFFFFFFLEGEKRSKKKSEEVSEEDERKERRG